MGDVTLAIEAGTGTAGAGFTVSTETATATGGIATFANIRIDSAGTGYRLRAGADGLIQTISTTFDVNAGAATALLFSVQPSNGTANTEISPPVVVRAEDAFGNLVTTFTDDITLTIETGTGTVGALLTGGGATAAVGGRVTFAGLSIDLDGTGYRLRAEVASIFVLSTTFNITATP